jgi:hypothetical protein
MGEWIVEFHFVSENPGETKIMILNEIIQLFEFVKILPMHRDHLEVRQGALHDQVALRCFLRVNT